MATKTISVEHIQRHDTSQNWSTINPILALAMIGVEDDTGKFKIGDGVTNWNNLKYSTDIIPSQITDSNSNLNYSIWIGTQEEYTNLENKKETTIYIIKWGQYYDYK